MHVSSILLPSKKPSANVRDTTLIIALVKLMEEHSEFEYSFSNSQDSYCMYNTLVASCLTKWSIAVDEAKDTPVYFNIKGSQSDEALIKQLAKRVREIVQNVRKGDASC